MGSLLDKNSKAIQKRIEAHTFEDEEGEEYESSTFGGFRDYFRRKKLKLQNLDAELRSASGDKPQIFRGIVAHINGYTQPSLNDLHLLIVTHGGGFMQYLDGKTSVTHIIAANLTPKKAAEFRRYRIVKPAWIVDSVSAGKLLPWDAYRVVNEAPSQRLLGFDQGKMVSQVNEPQNGYRDQMKTSGYTFEVRRIADEIDHGVKPGSTQSTDLSAPNRECKLFGNQQMRASTSGDMEDADHQLHVSESFELTSSLEDALNQATEGGCGQQANQESYRGPQPQAPIQPPPISDNVCELEALSVETTSNPEVFQIPQRRPLNPGPLSPSKRARFMTAEEHNAVLLSDPQVRKSSTANPDFLKQFYSESRLHHLSTWKAELKSRLQQMAAETSASQKPPKKKRGARSYIMHVDFDSFFCAVSLKNAPEFHDKPAVVAHGSGAGSEIASCNYPARAFGVKNGMWMKQALDLCPTIKVLSYDFPAYEEASKSFYEAILNLKAVVQSVSVDEALVDITALCSPSDTASQDSDSIRSLVTEQNNADRIAHELRKLVKQNTGCEVSIGIGANILLAKIALRKAKPAGQYQIKPEDVLEVVGELSVRSLPGVAFSIGSKLEELGVKLVKDVRHLTKDRIMTVLGPKTGEKIWDYSRGIDRSEVGEQVVRKSVSAEVNWGIRFISQHEAEEFVYNLCVELERRLQEQKVKGRQLTMKIMKKAADAPLDPVKHLGHGKCDTYTKSTALLLATNSAEVTGREAVSILRSYGFSPGELRGLGVQMSKLESIKAGDAIGDGSQKKLDFGKFERRKLPKQSDDLIDEMETPKKAKATTGSKLGIKHSISNPTPPKFGPVTHRIANDTDPIDDINSPKKEKQTPMHPATVISRTNATDQSAKKLNILGTQFVLPTQTDPAVLAELPQYIKSRLVTQGKSRDTPGITDSPSIMSKPASPRHISRRSSVQEENIPLPSQLDLEVFEALPEDMKAEVLASFSANIPATHRTINPQSPRKTKVPSPEKRTPAKKRGRPIGSKNKREDPFGTLKQSNFVLNMVPDMSNDEEEPGSVDPEFLAALPEELRLEILAENRQTRLTKRGGIMTATIKKSQPPEPTLVAQRKMALPTREPRPTFTTRGIWKENELRSTIQCWYTEFKDEGPHTEDVQALQRYLRRVVVDERDLSKARSVVKWLIWLVDEDETIDCGQDLWNKALTDIKNCVQDALKERGLGAVDL